MICKANQNVRPCNRLSLIQKKSTNQRRYVWKPIRPDVNLGNEIHFIGQFKKYDTEIMPFQFFL